MLQLNVPTKSSLSAGQPQCCVVVTWRGETVEVRDSKLGDASPVRTFTAEEFGTWCDGVERDLADGQLTLQADEPMDRLSFTVDEWLSFLGGLQNYEFLLPAH